MIDSKFSIGGQFNDDSKIFYDTTVRNIKQAIFDGASSSLRFIIKEVNFKKDEYVLLPSYLCPTIIDNFCNANVNIIFYSINYDFSINLNDLKNKIQNNKIRAIYFIEYFGMNYDGKTIEYLKLLKLNGCIIIQDAVHKFYLDIYDDFIGTYCFNSLRKFGPIDGSILFSDNDMKIDKHYICNNKYLCTIEEARNNKYKYLNGEIDNEDVFLNKFLEAEEFYQKNREISILPPKKVSELKKLNLDYIRKKRIENFNYLYKYFEELDNVKIVTEKQRIKDIPFAMIILVEDRNNVRKKLFNEKIFCPVLWNMEMCKDIIDFEESLIVSKKILMIPIDQRYNLENMRNFIEIFNGIYYR